MSQKIFKNKNKKQTNKKRSASDVTKKLAHSEMATGTYMRSGKHPHQPLICPGITSEQKWRGWLTQKSTPLYVETLHWTAFTAESPFQSVLPNDSVRATGRNENLRAQELCESRGGRPGLPVPSNSPYGLCGRKATLNLNSKKSTHLEAGISRQRKQSRADIFRILPRKSETKRVELVLGF